MRMEVSLNCILAVGFEWVVEFDESDWRLEIA